MSAYKVEAISFDNKYTNNIHGFSGNIETTDASSIIFKNIYTKQNNASEKISKINILCLKNKRIHVKLRKSIFSKLQNDKSVKF